MTDDRWERMAKDRMEKDGGLWSDNVAKLLRAEHRAMVNLIMKYRRRLNYGNVCPGNEHGFGEIDGSIRTCEELLAKLKERGK